MGLDFYVGTLSRYHSREWQTELQRDWGAHTVYIGLKPGEKPPDLDLASRVVEAWRRAMGKSLRLRLDWSESPDQPYFTEQALWPCFHALRLWAACDDQGVPPAAAASTPPADWDKHPALKRYQNDQVRTRYSQLLLWVYVWLPLKQPVSVFEAESPGGARMRYGNVRELLEQLKLLNRRTWRFPDGPEEEVRKNAVKESSDLDGCARHAWLQMRRFAELAVKLSLPMVLDY